MANIKRKHGAVYQRIRDWVTYDGDPRRPSAPKLWKGDEEVYQRLVQLRSLLFQKAYSHYDCLPIMVKSYGISEATFFNDLRGLRYIFADLEEGSRDFERLRLKELAMKAFQVAAKKEDSKAMSAALRNLITLGGYDRDEPERINPDMLNPGVYTLTLDDATRRILHLLDGESGTLDLTKIMNDGEKSLRHGGAEAEEIDYEPLPGGAGEKGD